MTQHVRDYLLQQLVDLMLINQMVSQLFLNRETPATYPMIQALWYWQVAVFLAIAVVGIWRPRPDPVDFRWSQTAEWLYLYRERGAETVRQNMSGFKWCLIISALWVIVANQFQMSWPQLTWLRTVSWVVVGLNIGLILGNILLWAWRQAKRRVRL